MTICFIEEVLFAENVYTLYLFTQIAAGYALRNTIEPGIPEGQTRHPLRQMLDQIATPWCV